MHEDVFNGIFAAMGLCKEICGFLEGKGIGCFTERVGTSEIIVVRIGTQDTGGMVRMILPIMVRSGSIAEAERRQIEASEVIRRISELYGSYPLIITEDRWNLQKGMMHERLLAHLEIFFPVYARNCEVRKIDKSTAATFLKANHSYGDAACRYRYGLYIKRHTGHLAATAGAGLYCPGTLVAVATFSNARKWIKGDKTIRSYEWTRYASLPGVRVTGGMGKLLETFIEDVRPDDIMSYADLEWSEGKVYEQLGFTHEGRKAPVMFMVDKQWRRSPVKPGMTVLKGTGEEPGMTSADNGGAEEDGNPIWGVFQNFGSRKYRLKLTEYDQTYDE